MIRREIADGTVVGVLFMPEEDGPSPGVLVLGGSRGGVREELARALSEHGLSCLALAYFGADGLPSRIVEVPVEQVAAAAGWLARSPGVTGGPVGIVGGSKGAELALLAAAAFPDVIGPVVGIAPASVAFFGLDREGDDPSAVLRSSWSLDGRPVPFVPYPEKAEPAWSEAGVAVISIYDAALADTDAVQAAGIPIERARGPLLLVVGEDDRMWPSARMAEMILDRMARHGRASDVATLTYPGAGHRLLGAAVGTRAGAAGSVTFDYGGTDEADAEARDEAWREAGHFLRRYLTQPKG